LFVDKPVKPVNEAKVECLRVAAFRQGNAPQDAVQFNTAVASLTLTALGRFGIYTALSAPDLRSAWLSLRDDEEFSDAP
jgi:hypothetical protein